MILNEKNINAIINIDKKITKEDMYTKKMITDADVRMEYYKGILWFVAGYLYFHFVIMGWSF